MRSVGDTIAAVATPLGSGGVGIIRISGPRASAILAMVTDSDVEKLEDRYLSYGYANQDGVRVDEVLYVLMRKPRSFTGEDVAELHGHGGAANLGALLRLVIAAGARHAEPGEFTRRAFLNRRIDLTQAEAIADIVNASSEKALRIAQNQLAGKLGGVLEGLIASVVSLAAEIEAGIDFPEDGLSEIECQKQSERANDASRHCRELTASYGLGRVLRDGVDVVLRGPVNVGKSSLFNCLIGRERSIVAAEAGTTRDYVEAEVVWDGLPITLVDTAGTREVREPRSVEGRGIKMGADRAKRSDLELLVVDEMKPAGLNDNIDRVLVVRSKCDLESRVSERKGVCCTSSKTGFGIEDLKREIVKRVSGGQQESAEGCVVTNERQRSRFSAASKFLEAAAQRIAEMAPAEIALVELNSARRVLAEISGEDVGDEMLDALFSRFCIGK